MELSYYFGGAMNVGMNSGGFGTLNVSVGLLDAARNLAHQVAGTS